MIPADTNCSSAPGSNQSNCSTSSTTASVLNNSTDLNYSLSVLKTDETWGGDLVRSTLTLFDAFQLSLSSIPLISLDIVLLSIAGLTNAFVLRAMFEVKPEVLPAKFLLVSSLISNLLYAITSRFANILLWLSLVFGAKDPVAVACVELLSWLGPPLALFAQGFGFLFLACDRVYAICFPMVYKITGYSRPVKYSILLVQLCLPVGLLLPAILLPLAADRPPVDLCTALIPGYFMYTRKYRPVIWLIQILSTFAIYSVIFMYLKYILRGKSGEKHGGVSRTTTSLTIIYFCLHLTTVVFCAPVGLYSLYLDSILRAPPTGNRMFILNLLIMSLSVNSILDPILLIWRIPAIRKKLPFGSIFQCQARERESSRPPDTTHSIVSG